jgi:hypothetical protein
MGQSEIYRPWQENPLWSYFDEIRERSVIASGFPAHDRNVAGLRS